MTRYRSDAAECARLGFASASAAATAWQRWRERYSGAIPVDLTIFAAAANPDQALSALDSFSAAAPQLFAEIASDPGWLRRLVQVLGGSLVFGQALVRHPDDARLLATAPTPRGRDGWLDFFTARVSCAVTSGDADVLRRANRAALLEVAARDLASDDPAALIPDISAELSHIADAVLELALGFARAEVPQWQRARLAVVALGKTGGQELNYISDVDVVYLAEPAEDATAEEAVEIATKVAAALTRICSAHTAEGTIWPLDAGLRPEGKAGPLVRTLASCRTYYEKWAKNWEFQAMLKARPAAGDLALGEQFIELIGPMVWRCGERPEFLSEARDMRDRVVSLIPAKQADRDIKLGQGGLRDTEFSVQLLQLVHGRADERLRVRGTLAGLDELVHHGYIGRADGAQLAEAYRFQRLLEHRVQLRRLHRTHLIPSEVSAQTQVARGLGLDAEELQRRWRASRRQVQRLQQRIFFSPLLDAVSHVPTAGLRELRLEPEAAKARMQALGFADPRAALDHLEALTRGTDRRAEMQRNLMPAMLEWLARGPNPDFGLLSFRQLSDALGESSWYLRALRDEGYMAERLASVCATSRYVVDLLKRSPEMIRILASTQELRPRSAGELAEAMCRAADRHDDPAQAAASIRALRRFELCRIALADVLGPEDLGKIGQALSDLTCATIEAAISLGRRDLEAPEVGVIALGRWGGAEMSYSSDADCMFVIADGAHQAAAAATELIRRVAHITGAPGPDPALVLDTALRPEGRGGPQVRTISSYVAYYGRWASIWEAQMLLRARHGAGEQSLTGAVLAAIDEFRYPPGGLTPDQVTQIRRLKSRMEQERIPKGVSRERHLKLGPGGLSDVEWCVQLNQLRHAHAYPQVRSTTTLSALAELTALDLVPQLHAQRLEGAWRRASRLRDAIMLVRGRASDAIPVDRRELAALAVLLGYQAGDASRMLEDTRRRLRLANGSVAQLFWES